MDLITQDSKTTEMLFFSLDRVMEGIERMSANCRPVLGGERYLTGEEMCEKLHVSLRTLQDYRDTGLLGYVKLPGKILYKESDVEKLLEDHYRK